MAGSDWSEVLLQLGNKQYHYMWGVTKEAGFMLASLLFGVRYNKFFIPGHVLRNIDSIYLYLTPSKENFGAI